MISTLKDFSLTHAGIKSIFHPRLKTTIPGQTAIRYLRFMRPVTINRLELPRSVYGRWVPRVPCHPAHLIVSQLDPRTHTWKVVREVDLPADPKIAGQGINQKMPIEKMEAHFARLLLKKPYSVDLGGLRTDHLKVECDREHPVWPNHGECNGGPFNVPFGILNPLVTYGDPGRKPITTAPYHPGLKPCRIHPVAPKGMTVTTTPEDVRFEGKYLSLAFSTRRPVMTRLGWDILGQGGTAINRLYFFGTNFAMSGPVVRTLDMDLWPRLWTGECAVKGNKVSYSRLHSCEGISFDVTFTVEPDGLFLELCQTCTKDIPVLEAEPWRFVWDLNVATTSVAGVPSSHPGRSGDIRFPFMWAADNVGCLSCRILDGNENETRFQAETYKQQYYPWHALLSGFVLGPRPTEDGIQILPSGTRSTTVEIRVSNLEPQTRKGAPKPSTALRKHWATIFSCFRAEYRGFSNNAISTNCHVNQGPPIEVAAHTQKPKIGPNPLDLARFTIERAILEGGGYGYWRNLYLDADPILVSGVGRIYQAELDVKWLRKIEPGLRQAVDRMAGTIGKEGLSLCRDLTGNSGSFRWSSNACDCVGFGHMDAYVNAWTYRGFRNAQALLAALGDRKEANRCRIVADGIRKSYARYLVNPKTGWIVGWRSRDGKLHDYAFLWINGIACAFGLLAAPAARKALQGLERLRAKIGPSSARMGLPCNLWPTDPRDHMLPKARGEDQPTFETYTDGSLSGFAPTYYLRALSIHGLKTEAKKLAKELDEGCAEDLFTGGICKGNEFRSWEGAPTGYEGTLVVCNGFVYALAIEQGIFKPHDPEWWPKVVLLPSCVNKSRRKH